MGKNEIINDNELLYLIREGNEQALEIMYQKYVPLMEGKLNKFNIETTRRNKRIKKECRWLLWFGKTNTRRLWQVTTTNTRTL